MKKKQVVWNCHINQFHEIGCPHKNWTNEELLDALIAKKWLEQNHFIGQVISDGLIKKINLIQEKKIRT